MNIVVIDGQGGGIGRALVAGIKAAIPDCVITAVGTNSAATVNMQKGGADRVATGENAVVVACRRADVVTGPVGIAVADALVGEVTPKMAQAVGGCNAKKVLIPVNMCDIMIAGVAEGNVSALVQKAVLMIAEERG